MGPERPWGRGGRTRPARPACQPARRARRAPAAPGWVPGAAALPRPRRRSSTGRRHPLPWGRSGDGLGDGPRSFFFGSGRVGGNSHHHCSYVVRARPLPRVAVGRSHLIVMAAPVSVAPARLAAASVEAERVPRAEHPPDVISLLHLDPVGLLLDQVRAGCAAAGRIRDVGLADELEVRATCGTQHVSNESHFVAPVPLPPSHDTITRKLLDQVYLGEPSPPINGLRLSCHVVANELHGRLVAEVLDQSRCFHGRGVPRIQIRVPKCVCCCHVRWVSSVCYLPNITRNRDSESRWFGSHQRLLTSSGARF